MNATNIPNRAAVPILQRITTVYKLWHDIMPNLAKTSRYTLGEKIDMFFLEVIELIYTASFMPKERKLPYLEKAVVKLDLLKLFLQIAWEIKALDIKKYVTLSEMLDEIGRMLGGWVRQVTTPPGESRVAKK